MQSTKEISNRNGVMLNEFYLKGLLKDLLQGESVDLHKRLYEGEFLYEKLTQMITKNCYSLSKSFWIKAKNVLTESIENTPFVYFDENSLAFVFSNGADSEDLHFFLENEQLCFKGNQVVINPMFYQESYDMYQTEQQEYVHYQSARKLETFLLKKANVDIILF